jgi:hypothetical protein
MFSTTHAQHYNDFDKIIELSKETLSSKINKKSNYIRRGTLCRMRKDNFIVQFNSPFLKSDLIELYSFFLGILWSSY